MSDRSISSQPLRVSSMLIAGPPSAMHAHYRAAPPNGNRDARNNRASAPRSPHPAIRSVRRARRTAGDRLASGGGRGGGPAAPRRPAGPPTPRGGPPEAYGAAP